MDEWMDEWMDAGMDGGIDRWMDGWKFNSSTYNAWACSSSIKNLANT